MNGDRTSPLASIFTLIRQPRLLSVGVAGLVTVSGLAIAIESGFQPDLSWLTLAGLQAEIARAGVLGPAIYMVALAVSVVVSYIPGLPLAIAAGAMWGPLSAGIYTVVGGFIGSAIAYSLGRWWGPTALKWVTGKEQLFDAGKGEAAIGLTLFVTRLLPVFSFDAISYGAGVAGLSWPTYASATLLGMIPSTFAITYAGATIQMNWQMAVIYAIACGVVLLGSTWLLRSQDSAQELRHSGGDRL